VRTDRKEREALPEMSDPSRRRRTASRIAVPLLSAACLLLVLSCGRKEGGGGQGRDKAAPVETATVAARRETVPRKAEFVGSLAGVEQAVVSAEIEGSVARTLSDLGDPVRKGQVLAVVSPDEFRFRRDQAVSEADQAAARLGVSPTATSIDVENTSVVRKAAADYRNAKTDYERRKGLVEKNLIARKEVDDAEARLAVAEANLRAAREEANTQIAGLRGKRAAAALAEKKVADTSVRSPISGSVEARLVNAGEYVKVGTPLFRLVNDRPVKIVGDVSEAYASDIRKGQPVELQVEGKPGKVFRGSVARVSPSSDPANRTLRIEALFPNGDGALKAGFFGKGAVLVKVDPDAVTVPKAALVSFAGVDKVFVVAGGKASERKVSIGQDLGDRLEILSGVAAGEEVAVSGTGKLYEGAPVRPAVAPAPAPGAAPPAKGASR
jgi:RND family efflux transporter MFP subunit